MTVDVLDGKRIESPAMIGPSSKGSHRRFRNKSTSDFIRSLYHKLNSSLDSSTKTFHRQQNPDDPSTFRASGSGINFPTGVLLFLVVQTASAIWWAATVQSQNNYLTQQNLEHRDRITVLEMRLNKGDAEFHERVRAKVKEIIDDYGYLRVRKPSKGDDD